MLGGGRMFCRPRAQRCRRERSEDDSKQIYARSFGSALLEQQTRRRCPTQQTRAQGPLQSRRLIALQVRHPLQTGTLWTWISATGVNDAVPGAEMHNANIETDTNDLTVL
jgi:hypothetical protein